MKSSYYIACFFLVAALAAPEFSYAGGGCSRGGGGRRGAAAQESAAMKERRLAIAYDLGRRILLGTVKLRHPVPDLVKFQSKALQEFKERAPNERIENVVGRLSKGQLIAVQHYLAKRYPTSSHSAEELRVARWKKEKADFAELRQKNASFTD